MNYSTMNYYYFDGQVVAANTREDAARKLNEDSADRFINVNKRLTASDVEEISYQEYQEIRSNRNALNANKIFNFF